MHFWNSDIQRLESLGKVVEVGLRETLGSHHGQRHGSAREHRGANFDHLLAAVVCHYQGIGKENEINDMSRIVSERDVVGAISAIFLADDKGK